MTASFVIPNVSAKYSTRLSASLSSLSVILRLISELIIRADCSLVYSSKSGDMLSRCLASSIFFTVIPVAKICGVLLPLLMNPAFSNAAIAARTRVSTSAASSFQPAFLAISKAELFTV